MRTILTSVLTLCGIDALKLVTPTFDARHKPDTDVKFVFGEAQRGQQYKFVGDKAIWKNMDFTVSPNGVSGATVDTKTPIWEGLHTLQWQSASDSLLVKIQVTCSDGDICNGQERWVDGKCKNATRPLCDDLDPCTHDTCDCKGICTNKRIDLSCTVECTPNSEPICAEGAQCGSDGVGGVCGSGCPTTQHCNAGKCESCDGGDCSAATGTCGRPIDLTATAQTNSWEGKWEVHGDNRQGIDEVKPTCNPTSPATELVYLINNKASLTGMEIRMISREGTVKPGEAPLDTLLELIEIPDQMSPKDACLTHKREWVKACSDDAYPPGDAQSRVAYTMKAGRSYLIVADAYALEQTGEFTLQFSMHSQGCTPSCESKFCGDDGCDLGTSCGDCDDDYNCTTITGISNRCLPKVCIANCTGRACGDDGCGGSCGNCNAAKHELCVEKSIECDVEKGECPKAATCEVFLPCDSWVPKCSYQEGGSGKNVGKNTGKKGPGKKGPGKNTVTKEGCPSNHFCGSDCQCHHEDEHLPDIIMDEYHVDAFLSKVTIPERSCIVAEGYSTPGFKKMIKFATNVGNQGRLTYTAPPAAETPSVFEFAPCHGHFHFRSFISWRLLDVTGKQVKNTSKFSYCIEDSYRMVKKEGKNVPCSGSSDCENQGLNIGWFDTYPATVDGQFIVVDDLPDGHYILEQCANVAQRIVELSTENNCIYTEIDLGNWDSVHVED